MTTCLGIEGKPEDWTIRTLASGRKSLVHISGRTQPGTYPCYRFLGHEWKVEGDGFVPMFTMPGAAAPSVDPVKRVTIEYASGRREVVE